MIADTLTAPDFPGGGYILYNQARAGQNLLTPDGAV